ncbi:MAG: tryptophan--tRNA ligase [Planctomycetes bacterium]|nr:tryptophan--tRNA ligase [Planctomycetota bacterium]
MQRLFSGIQPTGEPHIGNYLGAIRNWVALQDQYECLFCIVDYHAITIDYDPKEIGPRTLDLAATLLACGLDPKKCLLFVQSEVPEHTELAWILSTCTVVGDLARMHQFKEKTEGDRHLATLGLFAYPTLQTADIVLYKAEVVPVGEDQKQHLELARETVRRFNQRFGPIFPEPIELLSPAARVMGLDGEQKMSKSRGNHVALADSTDAVWAKLRPAKTDEARKRRADPGNPDRCNLFSYHGFFSPPEEVATINAGCRSAAIGCVDCKKALHANMERLLGPIRERLADYRARPDDVRAALRDGAARASTIARHTMEEVRQALGLR